MLISAEALHGIPGSDTISLSVRLGTTTAIALIDSGSTNNFMDKQFAVKHHLPLQKVSARNVQVAGGGFLISGAILPNCSYIIQVKQFSTDFKILPLKGYDIVLGVPWLKRYNPTTFDWVERKLTITDMEIQYTFCDHQQLQSDSIISANQCLSLLRKGASGYILQVYNILDMATTEDKLLTMVTPELQQLLQQFSGVFEEPKGSLPNRACDHEITLLPGAKPPNIRPYRMPNYQKNVVEQIVQDMLQNQVIRLSTSPFSSTAILVRKKGKILALVYELLSAQCYYSEKQIPNSSDRRPAR